MLIERKPIRAADRRMRLCLIIPLGNGAKAQYPVASVDEARVLYEAHVRLNTPMLVPQG
ncbi:MAG: hypothetical protein ACFB5Z_17785 [Elainellaceae cyanobacterium]